MLVAGRFKTQKFIMKDRQTQRAVKNILHNELGITSEKVEVLITDYINKKLEKRIDDYLNSRGFEYMITKKIDDRCYPLVKTILQSKLSGISVNFSLNNEK